MASFIRRTFILFIILMLSSLAHPAAELFANDVVVTQKSNQGLTLDFIPQQWEVTSELIAGETYLKVNFLQSCFETATGKPQIPYRTFVIGIPFGASVSANVVAAHKKETLAGKIIPVPQIGRDSMAPFEYNEDAAVYRVDKSFPETIISVSDPLIMRDQHVVVLSVFPVHCNPYKNQIQLFERITVSVRFQGGRQNSIKLDRSNDDDYLYEQVLLNFEQAKKWRQSERKSLGKINTNAWGELYKIYINTDGIYKITGRDLRNAGLDLDRVIPERLKIFNNGGFPLPHPIDEPRPDSLIENAIIVEDGGDSVFDLDDYILFYGKSVKGWKFNNSSRKFSHYLHPYARENVYWLSWQDVKPGKRMAARSIAPTPTAVEVSAFWDHIFLENEYVNLLNSGTCWLGNFFSYEMKDRIYRFKLQDAVPNIPTHIRLSLAGISNSKHRFLCYFNDSMIGSTPGFYGYSSQSISFTLKEFSMTADAGAVDGYNSLEIKYLPAHETALAYMDWIELDYYRKLVADNNELIFYGPDSAGVYKYSVENFASDEVYVFDVTRFFDVALIEHTPTDGGRIEFIDSTLSDVPKTYLALSPPEFKKPLNIEKDVPSAWRNFETGADFIIITYDDFYDAVLPLKSLRENCDSLKTVVVKISDVYDEFSWGVPDPTAIRDFIKYAFDNWQPKPGYVLLFGDGDFDYKNRISSTDPNWIPPYETSELREGASRARDDWYVCVAGQDELMDLAIGRIPVRSFDQALSTVKKIINYKNSPLLDEWCNTITMVADDEFGQGGSFDRIDHIPDVENIAEHYIPQTFNVQKIYLTEYPVVYTASVSGIRKPAANEALLKQINRGCLIINFVGHGNERLWTHEQILHVSDDFDKIENGAKQAFWIAATCNFGRYDNPNFQSFAEQLVTATDRGAIATFTPCRAAISTENVGLNKMLYRKLFPAGDKQVRLGDAIMAAKNERGNRLNDQFYHLLGDPTLNLVNPVFRAQITDCTPDSIRALTRMKAVGAVENPSDSSKILNGKVLFTAYDSRKLRNYQVREGKTYRYLLPGNPIFRGVATVDNNHFQAQFFVPKDITYGGNDGRLSVFYWDDQHTGAGCLNGLPVGGTETNFFDNQGPTISIGFAGQDFQSGGFVPPDAQLIIAIEDSISGVNIAGDIGHKITMTLDQDEEKKIDLTDYFQYNQDSYQAGSIRFPLQNLSEGDHQIKVKAWDNCNNSSQTESEFTVVSTNKLIIRDLLNYPNPFSNSTEFTFWVNQDCDVRIKIYTLSGRLICNISDLTAETGFNHFYWDGLDQDGDPLANGVYLYKITATCQNGTNKIYTHEIQKCVIVR